ncbi:hypothetical protein PWG71_01325 [Nocardiopsis sp. N85]|uniref:hypothetical protein n=1 Tax=Nocardiopsis sp. N85 TaxID=3029400 RepID=UPI00237FCF2D|nr:hypothetical protein [Nocardiopsis sp. N85]MDE3720012.1 hypothetical protein [Nocardiopsis sp. N85]
MSEVGSGHTTSVGRFLGCCLIALLGPLLAVGLFFAFLVSALRDPPDGPPGTYVPEVGGGEVDTAPVSGIKAPVEDFEAPIEDFEAPIVDDVPSD